MKAGEGYMVLLADHTMGDALSSKMSSSIKTNGIDILCLVTPQQFLRNNNLK